jgi:hypothetical protein
LASGAGGSLISKFRADSLGLKPHKKRKNVGVSGAHEVGLIKGVKLDLKNISLGSITLLRTNTSCEELDAGQKVYGISGYPILSRYVVDMA